MSVRIDLQKLDGTKCPNWDNKHHVGDGILIFAITHEFPTVVPDKDTGGIQHYRPQDISDWHRRVVDLKWPNLKRLWLLVKLLELDPELWIVLTRVPEV